MIFPFLPKLITPVPVAAPQSMPHRMPPMPTPVASSTKSDSYCYRDANSSRVATSYATQRIIRCGGALDDDMANIIVAQLLYLDAIDPNKKIAYEHNIVDARTSPNFSILGVVMICGATRPPILFMYNRRNKKIHEASDGGTRGIKGNSHEVNKERACGGIEESKESGDQQVGSTVS
uniref:Uncharacterized protein n=1 Tax=Cucumis melo TaxID=3656 RepID=A0A1S3BPQ7_CUCME